MSDSILFLFLYALCKHSVYCKYVSMDAYVVAAASASVGLMHSKCVCVYCVCILFASLFSQIQRYTVCTEFPFCALNQLFIHHLLPFFKQIFKFPNEDSKISKVKRKNRIFALVQQKIDNNKKVQLSHKTKQIRRE